MSVQDYNKHIASMIDDSVRKYLQNELNIVNGNKTIRGGGSFPHSKPLPIFATRQPIALATPTSYEQMKGGSFGSFINGIKNVGHALGESFSKVTAPLGVNLNPFDAGYALGHDVISPYVVDPMLGKGMKVKSAKRGRGRPRKNVVEGGKIDITKTFNKIINSKPVKEIGNKLLDIGTKKAVKYIDDYANSANQKGAGMKRKKRMIKSQETGGRVKTKRAPSKHNMMLSSLMKQGLSLKQAWAEIKKHA